MRKGVFDMVYMNKKVLWLFLLIVLTVFASSCRSNPPVDKEGVKRFHFVTTENLMGVSSPDPDHIWILGSNSTVLNSSDGGNSWQSQKVPPNEAELYDVFFFDAQNGWVVGQYGAALHTTDGGNNWVKLKPPVNERLFDICFVDAKTGWIVGNYGTIIHTEDGGETWGNQGLKEDRIYNGVYFIDNKRGWVVGEYGTILHTRDGGKNWVKQECKELKRVVKEDEWETQPSSLYGIYFQTPTKGFAVGQDGVIISTEDGGNHWKRLESPFQYSLFKVKAIGSEGWAVGLRGGYAFTEDGGRSWRSGEERNPGRFWLRDLDFGDNLHGWAVGSRGTIITTQDGGKTWKMVSGIPIV
jgi:photosystem II stability/assembly factor-like uncharacterized protein